MKQEPWAHAHIFNTLTSALKPRRYSKKETRERGDKTVPQLQPDPSGDLRNHPSLCANQFRRGGEREREREREGKRKRERERERESEREKERDNSSSSLTNGLWSEN
jgi:hypothetical protein